MDKTTILSPRYTRAQNVALNMTHKFMRLYGINDGDLMYRDILAAIEAAENGRLEINHG